MAVFSQGRSQALYGPRAGVDRQRQLAEALIAQGSSTAPVNSPLEGLARALTGVVGGYSAKRADEKSAELDEQRTTSLKRALAAYGGYSDVPSIANADQIANTSGGGAGGGYGALVSELIGNPETADAGFQLGVSDIQSRRNAESQRSLLDYKNEIESQKPVVVAPGSSLVNRTTGEEITSVEDRPPTGFIRGEDGTLQADSGWLAAQTQLRQASKPVTNIKLPTQENEEAKAVGKWYGEQFTGIQEAATQARGQNARLDRLGQLLDQAYTGTGAEGALALKRAGEVLGVDVGDAGAAEAAKALSSEMALQLRNPAGGAGMPGAMSDKDREFLQSMVPGLTQTPEGRKMMIETQKRLNNRSIEVARMARQYRQNKGRLDEGFFDKLDAYSREHPLFDDLQPQATAEVPPAEQRQIGTWYPTPKGRALWTGEGWRLE